jgi:hypothetical protein
VSSSDEIAVFQAYTMSAQVEDSRTIYLAMRIAHG